MHNAYLEMINALANTLTAGLLAYTAREVRANKRERQYRQTQEGRQPD